MRKEYRRKAWLKDEDVLLEGYVVKRKFYPNRGIQCGFSYQKIGKRDIGNIIFFKEDEVKMIGLDIVK